MKDKGNAKNLVNFGHHIVRKSQICSLNKLTSKELNLILVDANTVKPRAQDYFENLFESSDFNWKKIYFLIRNTTLDTKARMFQYKVLHNTLCVKKIFFKFGKVISPRCSFCKLHVSCREDLRFGCCRSPFFSLGGRVVLCFFLLLFFSSTIVDSEEIDIEIEMQPKSNLPSYINASSV